MLLFLYGDDTFRSRQQMKKMVAKFKTDRDPQGLNVVVIDCEKEKNEGRVLEEILATPFLAERRMVVIENLLVSKYQTTQQTLLDRIEEKTLPASTIILFWEKGESFKTKLGKELFARLSKEKFAQKFSALAGAHLGGWIAAEVKERGSTIEQTAITYLIDNAGSDMWQLSNILDELIAYVSRPEPRSMTLADVTLFLDKKVDDNIFTLVDAIVSQQSKQVYTLLKAQYRQGNDVAYLFAMILRQCRILLELRDLFERDDSLQSDMLAKKLKLHPFVVKKSLPLVRRYTKQHLVCIYQDLLQLDISIKTGRGEPKTLLDLFVGRLLVGMNHSTAALRRIIG